MKFLFLFTFLVSVSVGNSQILKKTYHDWNNTHVKYVYYVNSRGEYNGLLTQYTYDGAKLGEESWVNGLKNGPYKEYFTRGSASKLKVTGNYKDDNKHGHWITYTYVKYGQSYFDIMQSMAFNDKEADIFNSGVQTKYGEEFFDNGQINKEIKYYPSGKMAYSRNYKNTLCFGEYLGYTPENQLAIKGIVGDRGKMIGTWIIPRENSGDCPKDKSDLSNVTYTQKIKFDDFGNIDTNYFSKTYYLSGKLRDSVRVLSIKYQGSFDYKGIWYLCGPNTAITGPYSSFYESGKIQTEGSYTIENGVSVKSGIWKNYDQNGNLIKEVNEDESRLKAVEAKKEAERIEKEKIEKERIAKEEKIAKENKEKVELAVLIEKADSSIIKVNALFNNFENLVQKKYSSAPPLAKYTVVNTGYSYVYVVNKKPELYFHFDQIQNSFKEKVEKLKKKDTEILRKVEDAKFYNKTVDFNLVTERNNIYSEIVLLGQKHMKLNMKMIDLAEIKTKNIEKQLETSNTVEEKIKILENYEFEPK
jgi:antitoxin component YwqK of YwqJK toxin-antitoxin module